MIVRFNILKILINTLINKIINPNFRARIFTHPPNAKKAFLLTHLDSDEMLFDFGDESDCLQKTIEFAKNNRLKAK